VLQPHIDSGRLIRLLPDWDVLRLPIHVVYPTRRHLSAKVQAMTVFLGEWFARQSGTAL
jgi:DNA-binding transcriptional LysR family regulator